MHIQPLYVGDLVYVKGFQKRTGVILSTINSHFGGIYYVVYWFSDAHCHHLPRSILKKIQTDTFCP